MNAFEAYKLFNALKLHFTSKSYDYFKYQGKVKWLETIAAKHKFLGNNQKYLFDRLARHEDVYGLVLANLLIKPKLFVTDLLDQKAQDVWEAWRARNESITYRFQKELETNDNWKSILKFEEGSIPFLLQKHLTGEISLETIIIINSIGNIFQSWKNSDHPVILKYIDILEAYAPFVNFNKNKCKDILKGFVEP